MLRLVGGVGRPDRGSVVTQGRIGALLDLGAGLEPELTGRENIYIGGIIAGMTRAEVAQRFDAIVQFAELEAFIDSPLRTYSTGMQMRLAFAVAAHIDPQILLIDEVLAVGDLAFQRKCLERIAQFKQQGCTILLVSHDPGQIRGLCDEVIWLRGGKVAAHGPTMQVLDAYVASMESATRSVTPQDDTEIKATNGARLRIGENRFGSQDIQIIDVQLLNATGTATHTIAGGAGLTIEITYRALHTVDTPIVGVSISRADGSICFDTSTAEADLRLPMLQNEGCIRLHIDRLDLVGGEYYVNVGFYERNWAYAYDYHWHVYPLEMLAPSGGKGSFYPPHRWDFRSRSTTTAREGRSNLIGTEQ
ncbi:ABC transporter ATP-binding protein [Candidatus Gracilibacteria bacterium]|nr:ABC transporter ATP-binding protein [Candidatus Gracilibacteria bacterium]